MSALPLPPPLSPMQPPVATAPLRRLAFHALGTPCTLQFACQDESSACRFERAAVGWVSAFEARYSRFRPDSLLSRINAAAGGAWTPVDADMDALLDLCESLHRITGGILDVTALPLLRLWHLGRSESTLPSADAIARARGAVGWHKVERRRGAIRLPQPGMALDFGGFGKEYAVDVVAQLAVEHGIHDVLVDFGHDLRGLGQPPGRPGWHIGLEDPRHPGTAAGSIVLTAGHGIASSGDYLRCCVIGGRRYGHIIDPRTGWPVANGTLQATVIAATCLHAGILSTTAFVLGAREGVEFIQSFPGAEGLIVTEHARAQTRGFLNHVASF